MAPEITLGRRDVDRRADVYALGCVAYYLLTGQLVFEADTPMKMLLQHLHAQPLPPSQRTEVPIPRELDELGVGVPRKNPDSDPKTPGGLSNREGGGGRGGGGSQGRGPEWGEQWPGAYGSVDARHFDTRTRGGLATV